MNPFAKGNNVTTFEYQRMEHWKPSDSNGWTSASVSARFESGIRGGYYLEYLPFGEAITEEPAAIELLEMLSHTALENGTVLDFGCGNGVLRELLGAARKTPQWGYIGLDINRENIESCKRRYPESRFEVVGERMPLPLGDESVDLVVASGVLELVEHPTDLLTELCRITRDWVALCRVGVRPSSTPSAIYWQTVRHSYGIEEHCLHVFS